MKGKKLTSSQKKALALDLKLKKLSGKEIAEKHGVTRRTVERYRDNLKKEKPLSALSLKRALTVLQVQSMIIFYLEVLERQTVLIDTMDDIKLPTTRCTAVRENLMVTLNIHNSLASFIDDPGGEEDYNDEDVKLIEALLTMIPEGDLNAKISEFTEKRKTAKEDAIQQNGRAETGVIPEKPGQVRAG